MAEAFPVDASESPLADAPEVDDVLTLADFGQSFEITAPPPLPPSRAASQANLAASDWQREMSLDSILDAAGDSSYGATVAEPVLGNPLSLDLDLDLSLDDGPGQGSEPPVDIEAFSGEAPLADGLAEPKPVSSAPDPGGHCG
ncbi:MAG: hypothetical protein HC929_13805 [Leptolyngbyaceae cyanobacterium SM2_5_2]|nr:hypothetical protein [Leptolyngbyaceae cyanobacterium SM2_5_2]